MIPGAILMSLSEGGYGTKLDKYSGTVLLTILWNNKIFCLFLRSCKVSHPHSCKSIRILVNFVALSALYCYSLYVIVCGVFFSGSESVQVLFIVCSYLYYRWRPSYHDGRVGIPLTGLTSPNRCACSKLGPGFPT